MKKKIKNIIKIVKNHINMKKELYTIVTFLFLIVSLIVVSNLVYNYSLVKQNKELFSLVYPQALEQMKSFEDSDVTRIKNIFLNSFYDGVQLNNLIPNNNTFIEYLTKTDLFKYCKEILSDSEKTKYLC